MKWRRHHHDVEAPGAFGRHAPRERTPVEVDEREREEKRIRDILSAEYSYEEIQVIAANMRREMERRAEVEELFGELNGYELYENACFMVSLKRRERARLEMEWLRRNPVLHREFRQKQNEWRRNRSPEQKERDKRLKAAWAKANAARLNERRKERDALMRAERPEEYRARARERQERRKARPQHKEQARALARRYYERLKQDPERYERKKVADRGKKRRWYERNAERAKEAERARRRGPKGDEIRARDRERHHAQRDERAAAAKRRREARSEEARRKRSDKQREWYLRNRERVLARVREHQSDPARRAAKREYDRARYAAGVDRRAA